MGDDVSRDTETDGGAGGSGRSWRRYYIPLNLLFLGALATMLARFHWLDVAGLARSASSGLLLLALGVALAAIFLQSLSWRAIALSQGMSLGPLRGFLAQLASRYWAEVTPNHVGEFMRISYLRSPTQSSTGLFLSSHTMDLLVGNVALVTLGMISLLVLAREGLFSFLQAGLASGLALVFLAWLGFLFLHRRFHRRLFEWLGRLPVGRKFAASLSEGTGDYHGGLSRLRIRSLLLPFWLRVAALSANYLAGYCIAASLGIKTSFHLFYLCLAVGMLVSRVVPIGVFKIGSGSATVMYELTRLGVVKGQAGAYILLEALMAGIVLPTLGAGLWYSGRGRRDRCRLEACTTIRSRTFRLSDC